MAIQSCDANLTSIPSPNLYALSTRRDSMTDTSFPVKPIDGYDLSRAPLFHPASHQQRYHAPAVNGDPGDDGQISCICDFADDDGYTVQCDKCHRWQHQSCYYPEYDEQQLPEALEHCCVDCVPKNVDIQAARRRQMTKRGHTEPHTNGVKRAASKSHKKKAKEHGPPPPPYTNGWPTDKLRHDRNSASPRDQPPPAKRPKTSHRASDSTTSTSVKAHSRKRNVSSVHSHHRRTPSQSPESPPPIERYSENFMRLYADDHWSVAENNLHDSIAVTNSLSQWVEMPDDEFGDVHGHPKGTVLNRYDSSLEDMPGKAVYKIVERRDDDVQGHAAPLWKAVIVEEPMVNGCYIGELKGRLCFKQDYQADPANRWRELRHPEPFVFFHPQLPIALDARNEGTDLRFIRRSCDPNARLQILITDEKDYHFCFLSTRAIDPGEEIAIAWETKEAMPLPTKNSLSQIELEQFSTWASTALANCGPCACGLPTRDPDQTPNSCSFARFDRRLSPKGARPKKRKNCQNGQDPSPPNTNVVNSRSGSEARRHELEDDVTDSQSASGSVGRGSASRDITPNTHYSASGNGMPEMSEREKKKLAKEEEMFRRQEEEHTGKQAKKKRGSVSSSLNTPSATSSKQLGFPTNALSKYADANMARPAGQSSGKAATQSRKPRTLKSLMKPPSKVMQHQRRQQQPRPVCVEAGTQCDLDIEEAMRRAPASSARKQYKSLRQILLDRCASNNHAILASAPSSPRSLQHSSPAPADAMDVDNPSAKSSPLQAHAERELTERPRSSSSLASSANAHAGDTEMADTGTDERDSTEQAPVPGVQQVATSPSEDHGDSSGKLNSAVSSSTSPCCAKVTDGAAIPEQSAAKPAAMRLDMPPPGLHSTASSTSTFSAGTPTTMSGSMAQSPVGMTPGSMFPPSVVAAMGSTSMKKKLSLSDYTRRKAKKEDSDAGHGESSPSSVASGPVVPPLQPSSSTEAHAAQGNAIEEDVKMEEAEHAPPPPPMTAA